MAPSTPHNGQKSSAKANYRKSSKVNYLSWAVQAKLKRQQVDEMMIKRAYRKDRILGAPGTGANEGVQDRGWSAKRRADGDTSVPEEDEHEQGGAIALGADRTPMKIPEPTVERTRLPKERPKKIHPPVSDAAPAAGPSSTPDINATPSSNPKRYSTSEPRVKRPLHNPETDGPRFRDLKRAAYGPSSLHNFKSRSAHEKSSGAIVKRSGKGQPNMKLRIDVMLEQIKRSAV